MTIQAKGWLSNVVHNTSAEDFDDSDELIDCESVDFFIVWHRFANYKTFPKTLMVIFPVLGCFPVYRLTVSQARKTNQKH